MKKFDRIKRDFLDDMLAFTTLCDQIDPEIKKYKNHRVNLFNLRKIEPQTDDYLDYAARGLNDDRLVVDPDYFKDELTLSLIGGKIDYCSIREPHDLKDREKWKYQIVQIKRPSLKELRNRVPRLFPNTHSFSNIFLGHKGEVFSVVDYFVPYNDGLKWKALACVNEHAQTNRVFKNNTGIQTDDRGRVLNEHLRKQMALMFTDRYEWNVELGYQNGGPTFKLIIPPRAIPRLFKLRDVPDGKKRRAALRNWITDHWRQKPESDESTYVRKHLRGSLSFTMDDMKFVVHPSEFDLDKNESLRVERERMKLRKHG